MSDDSPQDLLRRFGLSPKKSWGQNFLAAPDVLDTIVRAAAVEPGAAVVELGPGLGHLTAALLAAGARVTAVERDRDMVRVLRSRELPGLSLVEGNAAETVFADVAKASPVTVVGNLPYHLTSPILFQVLDQEASVARAVFTVQEEVADRLAAPPGTRAYGLLSVLLGMFYEIETVARLPARLFHPPPKVDSAVVQLQHLARPRAEVPSAKQFRRVVKAAFAQRRKMLRNSLESDPSLGGSEAIARALESSGIDGKRRAETLSIEEMAALARGFA